MVHLYRLTGYFYKRIACVFNFKRSRLYLDLWLADALQTNVNY